MTGNSMAQGANITNTNLELSYDCTLDVGECGSSMGASFYLEVGHTLVEGQTKYLYFFMHFGRLVSGRLDKVHMTSDLTSSQNSKDMMFG